jgi:hypothetical protein
MYMERDLIAKLERSRDSNQCAMQIDGDRLPRICESISLQLDKHVGWYAGAASSDGIVAAVLAHKLLLLLVNHPVRLETKVRQKRAGLHFKIAFPDDHEVSILPVIESRPDDIRNPMGRRKPSLGFEPMNLAGYFRVLFSEQE